MYKRLRKLYPLLVICFISLAGMAQETKYIEVVVSDSLVIMPSQFVYEVAIGSGKGAMSFFNDTKDEKEEAPTIQALETMLKKKKFNVQQPVPDFSVSKGGGNNSLLVFLNSKEELERLYNVLKEEHGISGKIKSMEVDKSQHTDRLFSKMFAAAKTQAESLAKVSNTQVGGLISAAEVNEASDNYMSMYKELLKNMPMDLFGIQTSYEFIYEKRFRFRFEIK